MCDAYAWWLGALKEVALRCEKTMMRKDYGASQR